MKKITKIILIIILILIGIFIATHWKNYKNINQNSNNSQPTTTEQDSSSILGCYKAGNEKDVYTLDINSIEGNTVTAKIAFKNFEKDSSTGTFEGTYTNGVLLGNYTFQSEGTQSVMQVIFKKVNNDFVRGYGDVDSATGTKFTDLNNITYDSSSDLSVFKNEECSDNSLSDIVFPKGGENLVMGKTYTLQWSGGDSDPTQIFLIDTKYKSAGVSVSLVDRIYNVKNTGTYDYLIPKNIEEGVYEIEIGNTTSNDFNIVKASS